MQYILQLTALGVQHHIFRVLSVDGQADIEQVISLCNLSFAYTNYADRTLYSAPHAAGRRLLRPDCADIDDNHFGPTGREFASWWEQEIDTQALEPYAVTERDVVNSFDQYLAQHLDQQDQQMLLQMQDALPCAQEDRPRLLYVLHGVQHLVEIKMCSEKLQCFLPATLAGEGLVPLENLSTQEMDRYLEQIDAQSQDESDYSVNLRDCTHRMRALGAFRGSTSVNDAMVQAGATALKFKLH